DQRHCRKAGARRRVTTRGRSSAFETRSASQCPECVASLGLFSFILQPVSHLALLNGMICNRSGLSLPGLVMPPPQQGAAMSRDTARTSAYATCLYGLK